MAAAANLRPDRMQSALGGVQQSIGASVQEQQQQLSSQPPQIERPSGVPEGHQGPTPGESRDQATAPAPQPERVAPPEAVPATQAGAATVPADSQATVPPPPRVTGNAEGHITESDAAQVQNAVSNLPVQDPSLNVDAGQAPEISLEGQSDPAWAARQRTSSETATVDAADQGHIEAAAPMGENNVYPHVPQETLRAESQDGEARSQSAASGQGSQSADDVEGIVAQSQSGLEIQSAASGASGDLAARRQEQTQRIDEAQQENSLQVQQEVDQSSQEQTAQRDETQQAVRRQRDEWRTGQQNASRDANSDFDHESQEGERTVRERHRAANTGAAGEVQRGNQTIQRHRQDAERDATRERDHARSEAQGGILGWLASAVTSFFNRIRSAIQAAFARARQLIQSAIQLAQRAASTIIDAARAFIVNRLHALANRLIEIANVLLAAFPTLRDRFTRTIRAAVDAAIAAVNRIADALNAGIQRLLNLLLRAINAILSLYERLYLAILNGVRAIVNSALQAARQVLQAYTALRGLIRDIAANPGQWLRNLGAAIVDGLRNHLWRALKMAVKRWFNEKVEMLLGVGRTILNVLRNGGIAFRRILAMAWNAIRAALPGIVITFLVQRLVAMLVPAAAAIMTIIQGLQAAWGTVSRIIQAAQTFFAFLRAVKTGRAGLEFAAALAAGAIAVIEFVSNFLLSRVGRALGRLAGRLRALAGRFLALLRRGTSAARTGLGGRLGVASIVRAVGGATVRLTRSVGEFVMPAVRRIGTALARTRLGQWMIRTYRGVRQRVQNLRERFWQWRERRRRNAEQRREERLQRAQRELPPHIRALFEAGVSRIRMGAQLLYWKIRYGLRRLYLAGPGRVIAANSPEITLADIEGILTPQSPEIVEIVHQVSDRFMSDPRVAAAADRLQAARAQGASRTTSAEHLPPGLPVEHGMGMLGGAVDLERIGAQAGVSTLTPFGRTLAPLAEQELIRMPGGSTLIGEIQAGTVQPAHRVLVRGGQYPEIGYNLTQIAVRNRLSQAEVARGLRIYIQSGTFPAGLRGTETRQYFAQTARLLINIEPARARATLGAAAMNISSVARGETGFRNLFGTGKPGTGVYPQAYSGSAVQSGQVQAAIQSGTAIPQHQYVQRMVRSTAVYVMSLIRVEQLSGTRTAVRRFIDTQFESRLTSQIDRLLPY
jgi:hypothetical protein